MGPGQEYTIECDTPFSILKLSSDGSNWVTFKTCFLFAMGGHDIEGHFNRSETFPPQPTLSSPDKKRWTVADKEQNDTYIVVVRKWQHNEKITCAQLAQVMSDLLLIFIQHAKGIVDMWGSIVTEFNKKGHMIQVDLCWKMMEKQASDADDIQAHLDEMELMHKRLSRMGVTLHDDDYSSMILMSLPESYTLHLETLTNAATAVETPLWHTHSSQR